MRREGLTTEDTEKHGMEESCPQITQITQIGRREAEKIICHWSFDIYHFVILKDRSLELPRPQCGIETRIDHVLFGAC